MEAALHQQRAGSGRPPRSESETIRRPSGWPETGPKQARPTAGAPGRAACPGRSATLAALAPQPDRPEFVAGQGGQAQRRTTTSRCLALIRSGWSRALASKHRGAALEPSSRKHHQGRGPCPSAAARWWRLWSRTQFRARSISPPPKRARAQPNGIERVRYPSASHKGQKRVHGAGPVFAGGLVGAGLRAASSSRANSLAVAAKSGARAGLQDRGCRHHLLGGIDHDERQLPPFSSRFQPARSGIGPLENSHDFAAVGGRSLPDPGPAVLQAAAALTEAFRAGRPVPGSENAPRRARRGLATAAATTRSVAVAACRSGLGAAAALLQEPVFKQGRGRRPLDLLRRSFQDRRRSLVVGLLKAPQLGR